MEPEIKESKEKNNSDETTKEGKENITQKESSPPKPTAFTLFELFRNTIPCANIDGTLHLFDSKENCYRAIDQKGLEHYLIQRYYSIAAQTGSLRIIKTCAELIMHQELPEYRSAENAMRLCLQNGILPLSDMEHTYFAAYDYTKFNPLATFQIKANGLPNMSDWNAMKSLPTPWMDSFLNTSANGIPVIKDRIWEMIGYLLAPDQNGKCFFMLQGPPNSGKSLLGRFIQSLFPDYKIAALDIDQLGKKNATSLLINKCINISMDLPNKALTPLAIRNIKLITGNDDITVEHKNGTYERYHGNCKFLFATNHTLTLRGSDSGLEERLICIPFIRSISPQQRNYHLLDNLLLEKDYIVAKALAYYRDLRNNNYVFSGSQYDLCKARIRYLPLDAEDIDASLCDFVETCCVFTSQDTGIHTEDLYNAYRKYCKDNNTTPIDNQPAFSRRMLRCYKDQIVKKKWRKNGARDPQWGFQGILFQPIQEVKVYNV